MGAAVESFIMLVGWAGIIAIFFLIYSLFTRIRRGPGNRGVIQRMPFLLPSFAFVISILVIMQLGIVPIQDYRGNNSQNNYLFDDAEVRFRVYEPGIAYVEDTTLTVHSVMEPGESINIVLEFFLNDDLIDTVLLNLVSGENESTVSTERVLNLDPGNYLIRVEVTFYENGVIVQSYNTVQMTLTQGTIASIYSELVEWSTFQFMINIGCVFFIIGGFCIGQEDKRERRIKDYDQKTPSSEEYRSYDW
ncbi:hypothetical protein EU527_11725 [Candidatus Thorarchaeota archaeon]|nr:MAG: hypothetical protein EU527_11725 [Candidatus Thorarchaeota archaeon]